MNVHSTTGSPGYRADCLHKSSCSQVHNCTSDIRWIIFSGEFMQIMMLCLHLKKHEQGDAKKLKPSNRSTGAGHPLRVMPGSITAGRTFCVLAWYSPEETNQFYFHFHFPRYLSSKTLPRSLISYKAFSTSWVQALASGRRAPVRVLVKRAHLGEKINFYCTAT